MMNSDYQSAREITIHLPGGEPDGTRSAELRFSTIQAMAFRRSQLSDAKAQFGRMIQRPGVYILLDAFDVPMDTRDAYIGESEDVSDRLTQHKKEFWEDTIVVVSKDETLTKAHVTHLESRLIREAKQNRRWSLEQNTPDENAGALPPREHDIMSQFMDQAKMLIGVLGCDLFRSPTSDDGAGAGRGSQETFCFRGDGFDAKMKLGPSGLFVVEKGSRARVRETDTFPPNAQKLRKNMLDAGDLRAEGNCFVFSNDYSFSSVSLAATVVRGGRENGRREWKLVPDGPSYGKWEAARNDKADGNKDR